MRTRIFAALVCLAMFAVACAGKEARKSQLSGAAPGAQEEYGPELPPQVPAVQVPKPAGPQPVLTPSQDGYALILGPGLARTLAMVGVLRAFEENAVKIRSVTGVEMGALMAVLWAGATMITKGALSPGELTAFILYLALLTRPMQMLGLVITTAKPCWAARSASCSIAHLTAP